MRKVTTTESEIVQFRQDVQTKLRQRVREAIETVLDEELAAALGCEAYQRCKGRRGYRNGSEQRPLTTEIGTRDIRVPRGRLQQNDGTTAEFRSELLPRYARRTKVIDEAILGIYLAGANSRRIRKALEPLLGTAHLSQECRLPRRRASEEVIRELGTNGTCARNATRYCTWMGSTSRSAWLAVSSRCRSWPCSGSPRTARRCWSR